MGGLFRRIRWPLLGALGGLLALEAAGWWMTGPVPTEASVWQGAVPAGMTLARAEARSKAARRKLEALAPGGLHVVVDTAANRLYLRKGEAVLREAVVSCGSGNVLSNPNGGQDWVFDTPRGEFKVESKVRNPLWVKPDWAYVEEGKAPPRNHGERFEQGVLGDYALGIGKGYFLHGTLYTRMLGRNVTHGCVRVGDDDLQALYRSVPIGAKVFLY
jgi:L,D-transpeptidase YbiS